MGVIVASFVSKGSARFYNWAKCDRFIVYMACFDALFNISHSMDHTHMLIAKDHVYPKELCSFYAFIMLQFFGGQNCLVLTIAINIFVAVHFKRQITFGNCDCYLLLAIIGIPLVEVVVALSLNTLGPHGAL